VLVVQYYKEHWLEIVCNAVLWSGLLLPMLAR